MKTLGFLASVVLTSCGVIRAWSAGTVWFENTEALVRDSGGRFFDDRGVFLSGDNYLAQLYAGTDASRLVAVGSPTPFLTADPPHRLTGGTGYFRGGTVSIPFISGGQSVFVQIRAWEAAGGSSFEESALSAHWSGVSSILYVMSGNPWASPPIIPAPLYGLKYPGNPIIVQEPKDQRIRAGQSASLQVIASGGVRLWYQWHEGEGGNTANPIKNATNSVYTVSPATTSMYWVQAYTSAGSTNSTAVTVTVIPTHAVALDLRVDAGVPVRFSP